MLKDGCLMSVGSMLGYRKGMNLLCAEKYSDVKKATFRHRKRLGLNLKRIRQQTQKVYTGITSDISENGMAYKDSYGFGTENHNKNKNHLPEDKISKT